MKELDKRKKEILRAIVQSHIDLNIPVGSMLLIQRYPIGLSSATIRNTMARLEEMGYIIQPHTSAGRIPTEKGYRFYIDTLMEEQSITADSDLSDELSLRLSSLSRDRDSLIQEAARTLSSLSRYLAIATPLKIDDVLLRRIRFIKYENRQVLAVIVSDDGIIRNRIIELDRSYTQKDLDTASKHLNSRFRGLTIKKVREKIAYRLYKEKLYCNELIENLLNACREIVPESHDDLTLNSLSGTSNLPDFASMEQIKVILKAIEDTRFMLKLLQQLSESQGTRVFVGMENIFPSMNEFSMVVSTYTNRKQASGAIGIIGPTRMNYKEMIPIVDHTAKMLTRILSEP